MPVYSVHSNKGILQLNRPSDDGTPQCTENSPCLSIRQKRPVDVSVGADVSVGVDYFCEIHIRDKIENCSIYLADFCHWPAAVVL